MKRTPSATGTVSVTRRARFSSARTIASRSLSDLEATRLFGSGTRLHGQTFELKVTVSGAVPDETGMVMDLKALSTLIKAEVVAQLDHRLANDAEILGGLPPTTENLAVAIWRRLEPKLMPRVLSEVSLWEGEDSGVLYRGE